MGIARGPSFKTRVPRSSSNNGEAVIAGMRLSVWRLLPRKPLRKRLDIDQPAGVAAVAYSALALEGFDLKADDAALHGCDFGRDPHRRADQRRAEMAHIDLGADRDPARLKIRPDGIARGHLHFQD